MSKRNGATITGIGDRITNGAKATIELSNPYSVTVDIEGTADILFHRWNCEAVEAKANAAKGSKAKKSDDIASYVYRCPDTNEICIPGEYLRQAIIHAAKFRQDPRSPRKSAMDLYKAGVVTTTQLASLGVTEWDYEHKARVQVQRNGITRVRPAMNKGWKCSVSFNVNIPEYIRQDDLHDLISYSGKLVGIGDFRPTYGRFKVNSFEVGLIA